MNCKKVLIVDYQSAVHRLQDEQVKEVQRIKKSIIYANNLQRDRDVFRKTRKKYLNWLLQIGAYLKDCEFEVFYVSIPDEGELFQEKLKWADAVFFWVKTSSYAQVKQIIDRIREDISEKTIIIGGYHATGLPEEVMLETPAIDYITIGESEIALGKILRGDPPETIRGIAYRRNGRVIVDRETELLAPDEIRAPDYSLLNGDRRNYRFFLQTTRGCRFRCNYCVYGYYWNNVRSVSAECIRKDLMQIREIMGPKLEMHITDNIVSYNMETVRQTTEIIHELQMDITFSADIRTEYVRDLDTLYALKELGVRKLFIGFEDADTRCTKSAGRTTSKDAFLNALLLIKQAGIAAGCYWMMGLPGTTKESFDLNIDFARKLIREQLIETICADIVFTPRPGTPMYNESEKYGIFDLDRDWTGFRRSNYWPTYSLNTISREEMYEGFLRFDKAVIQEQLSLLEMTAEEAKDQYFSSGCVEPFLL